MYSIGEFSKIGQISAKTLRYYDEIGLLCPAYVDRETRYRYYTEDQVDQLMLIAELKTYDLRLEQIKAIMESKDTGLLERFLKARIEQLNSQITEQIRLRQYIEKKVYELQSGGRIMEQRRELIVETREFKAVWVMSRAAVIEITQIGNVTGGVFEEIFKNGLRPAGPVMTFYLDREFQPEHAHVEVCVPIEPVEGMERIQGVKLLNPGLCAFCLYGGAYSQMGMAYAAVMKWIEENGYKISCAPFDVYLNDPRQVKDPAELLTEVWFPIQK